MPRNIRPFVFARQRGWLPVLSTIAITLLLLPACGPKGREGSPVRTDSRNGWEYPIRLGDPHSKVHQFLGNAARTTEVLEEYPMSGVTTWFDLEGRLAKLNFHGKAGALYSGPNAMMAPNWIPSDRPLIRSNGPRRRSRLQTPAWFTGSRGRSRSSEGQGITVCVEEGRLPDRCALPGFRSD